MTGWSPAGFKQYGAKFLEGFTAYWPDEVKLVVYGEEACPPAPRVEFRNLSEIPYCMSFLDRWRDNARANGREPNPRWKQREREAGYSYRFDAWKFSRQGFIPAHAIAHCETKYLLWLDGDVMTHAPVDPARICGLLPGGLSIAYLGREPKHPDLAFTLYRVDMPSRTLLNCFFDYYAADAVFKLDEWHSAYVWRRCLDDTATAKHAHNMTPGGHGHVWFQSPLGQWMDHLKGDRKQRGRSHERR